MGWEAAGALMSGRFLRDLRVPVAGRCPQRSWSDASAGQAATRHGSGLGTVRPTCPSTAGTH